MLFDALQVLPSVPDAYREVLVPLGQFTTGFVVVFLAGWLLVEPAISEVVRRRNRNNPTIYNAVRRYLRLASVLVGIAAGLTVSGYGHVLAGSALVIAAATLAIGVAGQEVIGALISGLFLVANPNFNVGDWIAWDDNEGMVEAISFRTTRVRTPDNETMIVPNTELTTSHLVRPYGRDTRRVTTEVGIDYDDDVESAMARIREVAAETPAILTDPRPRVYLVDFDDTVRLRVTFWLRQPTRRDLLRARSQFATNVKKRFDAVGLSMDSTAGHELSGTIGVEHRGEQ